MTARHLAEQYIHETAEAIWHREQSAAAAHFNGALADHHDNAAEYHTALAEVHQRYGRELHGQEFDETVALRWDAVTAA